MAVKGLAPSRRPYKFLNLSVPVAAHSDRLCSLHGGFGNQRSLMDGAWTNRDTHHVATVLPVDFLPLCTAKTLSHHVIYILFILKCQNAIPTMVHFIIFYYIELPFNSTQ